MLVGRAQSSASVAPHHIELAHLLDLRRLVRGGQSIVRRAAREGSDVYGRFFAHNGTVREANDNELAAFMGTAPFKKLRAMSG